MLSYKQHFWINRSLNTNKFLTSISFSTEKSLLFPWVWYAKLKFLFSKSKLSGFRTLSKHFWVSFCRMLWVWSPEVKLYLDPCMRSEKNFCFSNSRLFLLFSISWNAKNWKWYWNQPNNEAFLKYFLFYWIREIIKVGYSESELAKTSQSESASVKMRHSVSDLARIIQYELEWVKISPRESELIKMRERVNQN